MVREIEIRKMESKNSWNFIRSVVMIGMFVLLLLLVLALIFSVVLFWKNEDEENINLPRNHNDEETVGIIYNGEFLGQFRSLQEPDELNFENQVDGLLFFPIGFEEEGMILYECTVEYRCGTDNNNFIYGERRQDDDVGPSHLVDAVDPIDYITLKFKLFIIDVSTKIVNYVKEKARKFTKKKLEEEGKEDCEIKEPECEPVETEEIPLTPPTSSSVTWICDATCEDDSGLLTVPVPLSCWVTGEKKLEDAKIESQEYFERKCIEGEVQKDEMKTCLRNKDGVKGELFRIDGCEENNIIM